jgi:2-keto-4-pentenoate hydratase/2-oxohepta-3-ene-1,7-dioic acid hydratase in catechol pathway
VVAIGGGAARIAESEASSHVAAAQTHRGHHFGVGELIAPISAVNPLLPGDVIVTGTQTSQ